MSEEKTEEAQNREKERTKESLAKYLVDPDGGLLVQGVANVFYSEVSDFAKKYESQLEEAYEKRELTHYFKLKGGARILREMIECYGDRHLVWAIAPSSMSNLLGSPLFYDVREEEIWYQDMTGEKQRIEEWLMRKICGLGPSKEITTEVVLGAVKRAKAVKGDFDQKKAKAEISRELDKQNYSLNILTRILFKAGAKDVSLPDLLDESLKGHISSTDARIFLAIKLMASYSLFSEKLKQIGLDPMDTGERLFGDIIIAEWLPKPAEAWPWAKELVDDATAILFYELAPLIKKEATRREVEEAKTS